MIEVEALTKRFGVFEAVAEVSFSVKRGELLALVGASGSGKTTTLKMINRLIEPSAGTVRLDGADTRALVPHELRRRIGYVFQKIGLFPHMTVAENLRVPLSLARWPASKIEARVAELMTLVELDLELLGRRPTALSGGQAQRVGVARALAAEPQVVLLDEPFGALDPLTRDRLQQSFVALRARLGLTAVLVTHDIGEALLLADRIAVMKAGRIVQLGTPRELIAHPGDEDVERLLATPRRQAEVFEALARGAAS